MPVSQDATTFPTFSIKINDVSDEKPTLPSEEQDIDREHKQTAPVWGYCAQQGPPDHCGSGQ